MMAVLDLLKSTAAVGNTRRFHSLDFEFAMSAMLILEIASRTSGEY